MLSTLLDSGAYRRLIDESVALLGLRDVDAMVCISEDVDVGECPSVVLPFHDGGCSKVAAKVWMDELEARLCSVGGDVPDEKLVLLVVLALLLS